MGYHDLILRMKKKSGLSDAESAEALTMMVESLAERLETTERMDFASQLPAELQEVALSVTIPGYAAEHDDDLVAEFMEKEQIDETSARRQIMDSWATLKALITDSQIRHIKAKLPTPASMMLY